jgi:predicted nucleotidyltransferase component of viral defense system
MIDPREINEHAGELSLQPSIVEKDYVLGWVLAGIAHHPEIKETWIFKGGTCLKKVHFETYRFSEDLDFTLSEAGQLTEEFLGKTFSDIARWIYEQSGIEVPTDQIRFEVYRNNRGGLCAEGRIYYRGPLQPRGSLPRIKLDLTADEVLVLEPATQRVVHPYADDPPEGITVRCYPFTEVFAEKIRALAERGRPRDLYDVVNLYRREEARQLAPNVRDVLAEKCRFKGMGVPTFAEIRPHRDELEADWQAMLDHQLPLLPPFEGFWDELPQVFRWLEARERLPSLPSIQGRPHEEVIRGTAGSLSTWGMPSGSLQTIRFAGANHLCVDLDYVDESGRFATRTIEPYSLRRTSEGNVILHAYRADGSGRRSYRVDRIRGARITKQTFVPRFAIELTPIGVQAIPATEPRPRKDPSPTRRSPRKRRSSGLSMGPTYVYECPICRKRFRRKKQDPKLSPHKDKSGWPCGGRAGYWVDTRY